MNAKEFEEATGDEPRQDDLERANCILAGASGHQDCGICEPHGLPISKCALCFILPAKDVKRKPNKQTE